MRKLAWLTLVAAAALAFSAPESAFAHGSHHHATHTQSHAQSHAQSHVQVAPVAHAEHAAASEETQQDAVFVSASAPKQEKCPHGQGADCGFCCACAGGASVALATPDLPGRALRAQSAHDWRSLPHELRQAILDLSRPPKSFA